MKLGEWLQIAANLGIMVGLVMVALQMRQTDAINASQLMAQYQTYATNQQIALGDDFARVFAKVIDHPGELTDEDLIRYHFFVNSYAGDLAQLKILADLGFVSPDVYKGMAASEITCGVFGGQKVGKAYLETARYGARAEDDTGRLIVKRLESCGSWKDFLEKWKERIAAQSGAA